jgi:hypothetical protein
MSDRKQYTPGPAHGAQLKKGGEKLNAEYAKQFGIKTASWPPQAAQEP